MIIALPIIAAYAGVFARTTYATGRGGSLDTHSCQNQSLVVVVVVVSYFHSAFAEGQIGSIFINFASHKQKTIPLRSSRVSSKISPFPVSSTHTRSDSTSMRINFREKTARYMEPLPYLNCSTTTRTCMGSKLSNLIHKFPPCRLQSNWKQNSADN